MDYACSYLHKHRLPCDSRKTMTVWGTVGRSIDNETSVFLSSSCCVTYMNLYPPFCSLLTQNTSVGCNPSMCTVTQCHFSMNFLLVGQLSCISSTSIMSNSVKGHNRANFLFYKVNSDCHHSKSSYFNCHSFLFFPACLR